ncbi:MAG: cobalamin-dependent protein [Planctomycetota bacterium]
MNKDVVVERLFDALLTGDRQQSARVVAQARCEGMNCEQLVTEVFWPTHTMIERLHREDKLSKLAHNSATRLLRVLCDRAAGEFELAPSNGRTIFAFCGPNEADELAAQIATDLLEREGFTLRYCGGGIAGDEILEAVNESTPDILLIFASAPTDLPEIRGVIDSLNDIGACRETQIVVGGGVFARASGLAEEIGADLWADEPDEVVEAILDEPTRRMSQDQRTVGRNKAAHARAA